MLPFHATKNYQKTSCMEKKREYKKAELTWNDSNLLSPVPIVQKPFYVQSVFPRRNMAFFTSEFFFMKQAIYVKKTLQLNDALNLFLARRNIPLS